MLHGPNLWSCPDNQLDRRNRCAKQHIRRQSRYSSAKAAIVAVEDAGQAERVLQPARRSRAYHRLASTTDPEFHLTTELLAARLGVTIRSVDRWARDPRLEFPSPDLVVFRRKYWKRATIEAWEERRRAAAAA
jgi:hypothetical protein